MINPKILPSFQFLFIDQQSILINVGAVYMGFRIIKIATINCYYFIQNLDKYMYLFFPSMSIVKIFKTSYYDAFNFLWFSLRAKLIPLFTTSQKNPIIVIQYVTRNQTEKMKAYGEHDMN